MNLDTTAFDAKIHAAADAAGVPWLLLKALVAWESGFDPNAYRAEPAVNDASRGLCQVLYATAQGLGYTGSPEGLFDPDTSLHYGSRYLAEQYHRAGNWLGALSAYNGGWRPDLGFGVPVEKAGVRCGGRTVPIGEFCNQKYVDGVTGYWTYYRTGKLPQGSRVALAGWAPVALFLVVGAVVGGALR